MTIFKRVTTKLKITNTRYCIFIKYDSFNAPNRIKIQQKSTLFVLLLNDFLYKLLKFSF